MPIRNVVNNEDVIKNNFVPKGNLIIHQTIKDADFYGCPDVKIIWKCFAI
jgi:hypothetical protein